MNQTDNKKLDINTPKGQESVKAERRALDLFQNKYPGLTIIHTDLEDDARTDVIIAQEGKLLSIAEVKCRDASLIDLTKNWQDRWLVTWEKLEKNAMIADYWRVPFYGFLYLGQDDLLMVKKIYHAGWWCDIRKERTKTQKTINGGVAYRMNAYILMSDALIING